MEHEPAQRAGPDTAAARHEIEQHDPPQIYVASLADYNAGVLHGAWIDATVDLEEISERVERMLATSPTTPRAEEYAIHDFEGFGAYRPDEHDAIEWIHHVAAGIAEHGPAFAAWAAQCKHDTERLGQFTDAYLGDYDTLTAYAEQLVDDLGLQRTLDEHIPEGLQAYITIDTNALACDLELGGDISTVEHEHGVWIFDPRI